MRLRVNFGMIDYKEVSWWQPLAEFPRLIKFFGDNYEWVTYNEDDTGRVDYILTYSRLNTYDPDYYATAPSWNDMFKEESCECGSKYSSFPWDHLRYCKKWSPW